MGEYCCDATALRPLPLIHATPLRFMLRSSEELGPECGYGFNITDDWGKLLVLFAYDTARRSRGSSAEPTAM